MVQNVRAVSSTRVCTGTRDKFAFRVRVFATNRDSTAPGRLRWRLAWSARDSSVWRCVVLSENVFLAIVERSGYLCNGRVYTVFSYQLLLSSDGARMQTQPYSHPRDRGGGHADYKRADIYVGSIGIVLCGGGGKHADPPRDAHQRRQRQPGRSRLPPLKCVVLVPRGVQSGREEE